MVVGSEWRLGLRILHNGKGRPWSIHFPQRKFSSQSNHHVSLLRTQSTIPRSPHRCPKTFQQCLPAMRYASTTSGIAASNSLPPAADQPTNAWDIPLDPTFDTPTSFEPHIGYLKELGLDFGWGPTSMVQWLLEHVHVYSGLPWAGSVILAAVIVRASLVKFYFDASDMAGRQATILPYTQGIRDRIVASRANNDQQAMLVAVKELRDLNKKAGVNYFRLFLPTILQTPLGFGTFILARNMASLPVPGLENGGYLWFPDLTVPDPTYLLPALASGLMYYVFKKGGESGVMTEQSRRMMDTAKYLFPALSFAFVIWLPAIMQVAFATNSVLGLMQATVLRNKAWRERLGLHPLPESQVDTSSKSGPYKGVIQRYQPPAPDETAAMGPWKRMKAKAIDYMAKREGKASRLSKQEKTRADRYEQQRKNEIEADIVEKERQRRRR